MRLCRICIVQTQPRKRVLQYIMHIIRLPSGNMSYIIQVIQAREQICPQRSTPWSGNRLSEVWTSFFPLQNPPISTKKERPFRLHYTPNILTFPPSVVPGIYHTLDNSLLNMPISMPIGWDIAYRYPLTPSTGMQICRSVQRNWYNRLLFLR